MEIRKTSNRNQTYDANDIKLKLHPSSPHLHWIPPITMVIGDVKICPFTKVRTELIINWAMPFAHRWSKQSLNVCLKQSCDPRQTSKEIRCKSLNHPMIVESSGNAFIMDFSWAKKEICRKIVFGSCNKKRQGRENSRGSKRGNLTSWSWAEVFCISWDGRIPRNPRIPRH